MSRNKKRPPSNKVPAAGTKSSPVSAERPEKPEKAKVPQAETKKPEEINAALEEPVSEAADNKNVEVETVENIADADALQNDSANESKAADEADPDGKSVEQISENAPADAAEEAPAKDVKAKKSLKKILPDKKTANTQKAKNREKRKKDTDTDAKHKAFDYEKAVELPDSERVPLGENIKRHLLSSNPVFIKALAIVPVLGAGFTLKNGILLSVAMLILIVALNAVMYPLHRVIPRGFISALTLFISAAIITPVCMAANYFAPDVVSSCFIYLPLLAVCALPMVIKSHYGRRHGFFKTLLDSLLEGVGFAAAAVVFSAVREILGSGTLYDRALPNFAQMKFNLLLVPAGAFILLGLLIALFRKIFGNDGGEDYNK